MATLATNFTSCSAENVKNENVWKNFGPQFQYSSAGIAKISAIRQKRVSPKPNVLSVGRATITKDALTERFFFV